MPAVNWRPPAWWRSAEQQLTCARQLWPDVVLPEELPEQFVPQTKTEVLLLHVPRPFDELWNTVAAPSGYTKWRWDGLKSDKCHLKLADKVPNRSAPVWLAFDPEANKGERPDRLWGRADLAGAEVLSAVIQFPDWPLSWFNGASAPSLSGCVVKYVAGWSRVPYLYRWDDFRQLCLYANLAGDASSHWASPVVREC